MLWRGARVPRTFRAPLVALNAQAKERIFMRKIYRKPRLRKHGKLSALTQFHGSFRKEAD